MNNTKAMKTQTKGEFLSDCLIETLNDMWKVNALESCRSVYTQLEVEVGRKYVKIWDYLVVGGERNRGRSCWMFVDKNTGACYKPASYKAPAVGIRYQIEDLIESPTICDPYGSFLYMK